MRLFGAFTRLQLKMLDSPYNDFFIHVNKKVEMPDKDLLIGSLVYSKVYFSDRIKVICGCGIFKAATILLETAVQQGKYEYFHLMIGADLPLKSNEYIMRFLTDNLYLNHSGRFKTNYVDMHPPVTDPKMLARVTHYNLCVPFWKNKFSIIEFIAKKINRLGYFVQRILCVNRIKGL